MQELNNQNIKVIDSKVYISKNNKNIYTEILHYVRNYFKLDSEFGIEELNDDTEKEIYQQISHKYNGLLKIANNLKSKDSWLVLNSTEYHAIMKFSLYALAELRAKFNCDFDTWRLLSEKYRVVLKFYYQLSDIKEDLHFKDENLNVQIPLNNKQYTYKTKGKTIMNKKIENWYENDNLLYIRELYHEQMDDWLRARFSSPVSDAPNMYYLFPIDNLIFSNFKICDSEEMDKFDEEKYIDCWSIAYDDRFDTWETNTFLNMMDETESMQFDDSSEVGNSIDFYLHDLEEVEVYVFARFHKNFKIIIKKPAEQWNIGYIIWQLVTTVYSIYTDPRTLLLVDGFWRVVWELSLNNLLVKTNTKLLMTFNS